MSKKIIYMTLDELAGKRVILKRNIITRGGSYEAKAGIKATLLGGYGRPHLKTDECPCCGGQLICQFEGKKELAYFVDLLPEEEEEDDEDE